MRGLPALRHALTAAGSRAPSKQPCSSDSGCRHLEAPGSWTQGPLGAMLAATSGCLPSWLRCISRPAGRLQACPEAGKWDTDLSVSVRLLLGALAKSLQETAGAEPELVLGLTLQHPGAREAGRASATGQDPRGTCPPSPGQWGGDTVSVPAWLPPAGPAFPREPSFLTSSPLDVATGACQGE